MRDNIQIIIENNKNYGRTIFGMLSFITAYTECDYYADELMEYLEINKDYVVDFIKERIPRIKLAEPEEPIYCGLTAVALICHRGN